MGYGLAATMIRFTVRGIAQSAGSKSAYTPTDKAGNPYRTGGRIVTNVVDANPKAKDWKRLVAMAAQQAYSGEPLRGPVEVRLIFFRQRPKGHYRTGKNAAELREGFARFVTSIVGEFPIADLSCWTQDALERCTQRITDTSDPSGVCPSVPFE